MTGSPDSIARIPERATGTLYDQLRADAIAMVQAMSGDVWTNYNYSDPGVTIIEQLAYALTELPYRAQLPVADLLAEPGLNRVPMRKHAMFPAWSILPCNPVTIADLRRLLIDRVDGVGNLWVVPARQRDPDAMPGLFDIRILAQSDEAGEALIEAVRRCYVGHRNLGEDIRHIELLRPVATDITARILIADDADPDDVMANALFALSLALAPEPQRLSFADWRNRHRETTALFDGPLMRSGFIDAAALGDEPTEFSAEQLAGALAAAPGVLAVDALSIRLEGSPHESEGAARLKVPADSVLRLRTSPSAGRDGAQFPIRMVCNGRQCTADPVRVRRKLRILWSRWRQVWPLRQAYAEAFPTPQGRHHDLADYVSVQDQFPFVYGIGANGLPLAAPPARRAAARQLKAYLMPFDQTLANGFAQLAFMRQLLSIAAGGNATYASQSLRPIVPDADPLLLADYEAGLQAAVAETDPVARRRLDALGLLMGFLGLRWTLPGMGTTDPQAASAEIDACQTLLRRAAIATRDRGRGIDYLAPEPHRRLADTELLSRVELGLLDRQLAGRQDQTGDSTAARLAAIAADPDGWLPLDTLPDGFDPDSFGLDGDSDDDGRADRQGPSTNPPGPGWSGDPGAYRIGRHGAEVIVVAQASDGRWWLVARFDDEADARHVLALLRDEAGSPWRRRFTLVDWVLLRHGVRHPGHQADCTMRATAVLSAHENDDDTEDWRTLAPRIIRANAPAHIAIDCLFLDSAELDMFDRLHRAWRLALAHRHPHRVAETSHQLAAFLQRHLGHGDGSASPPDCDDPSPDDPDNPDPPRPDPHPDPATPPEPDPGGEPGEPEPSPPADPPADPAPAEPDDTPSPSFAARLWQRIKAVVRVLLWPLLKLLAVIGLAWGWIRRLSGAGPAGADEPAPLPAPTPTSGAPAPPSLSPPSPALPPQPAPGPAGSTAPQPPSAAQLRAVMAPAGARGFDCDVRLDIDGRAVAFKAAGFAFAVRYLSRRHPEGGDLTASEVRSITAAGLALMPVQHVMSGSWHPSASLGQHYGAAAARQALACGLPRDICVWLDLEGVARDAPAGEIIDYCNAWFDEVRREGFSPGLYVGQDCGLDSRTLGTALGCHYFWRSGSHVPDVAGPGYCMVQTINRHSPVAGVVHDLDVVQTDSERKRPIWAVLAGPR